MRARPGTTAAPAGRAPFDQRRQGREPWTKTCRDELARPPFVEELASAAAASIASAPLRERIEARREQSVDRGRNDHLSVRLRSSPASASISSTKSGLPSATSTMRCLVTSSSVPRASSSTNSVLSVSERGSSRIEVEFSFPPPQPGRTSRRSGRARQTSRIGAARIQSARCSIRSRNVGSPQWMSSKTSTSGARSANRLEERSQRTKLSSIAPPSLDQADLSTTRWATSSASCSCSSRRRSCAVPRRILRFVEIGCILDRFHDGPECDALAVRQTAPARDSRRSPRSPSNSRTRRDFPTPAAPSTVNSWHERSETLDRRHAQAPPLTFAADH